MSRFPYTRKAALEQLDILRDKLKKVREDMQAYFGARPNGDMAQDAFDIEFDALLDKEAELLQDINEVKRDYHGLFYGSSTGEEIVNQ